MLHVPKGCGADPGESAELEYQRKEELWSGCHYREQGMSISLLALLPCQLPHFSSTDGAVTGPRRDPASVVHKKIVAAVRVDFGFFLL